MDHRHQLAGAGGVGYFRILNAAVHQRGEPAVSMASTIMPDGPTERRRVLELVEYDQLDGLRLRRHANQIGL